jgi:hypothetical protein
MRRRAAVVVLLLALGVASASAYRSGSPLDLLVEQIGRLFSVSALSNQYVQVGVLRFALWLILFSLGFYSLQRVFKEENGRKIAAVLSGVIATIAALFLSEKWVLLQGGVVTALLASVILLGLVALSTLGIVRLSHSKLFLVRVLALVIVFFMLYLIEIIERSTGSRAVGGYLPIMIPIPILLPSPRRWKTLVRAVAAAEKSISLRSEHETAPRGIFLVSDSENARRRKRIQGGGDGIRMSALRRRRP